MKAIFLDHFGVMCLADKHGRESVFNQLPRFEDMRIHSDYDDFDKEAVGILNFIIKEVDADIVVSSDWKKWSNLNDMSEFYLAQGIIKPPIGFTPDFIDTYKYPQEKRACEIMSWLKLHREVTHWVAIDDMHLGRLVEFGGSLISDREWGLDNFVWVSRTDEGIKQDGIKEKLISILKN